MDLYAKEKIGFAITGVTLPIYNEYVLEEDEGKECIFSNNSTGIFKEYNPLYYTNGKPNLTIYKEFVNIEENPQAILSFVKRYGLLWSDENNKRFGFEINFIDDILRELRFFKKACMLHDLLVELNNSPQNQEVIEKFNNIVEYRDPITLLACSNEKIKEVYKENIKEPYWKDPKPGLVKVVSKEPNTEKDIVVIKPELQNDLYLTSKRDLVGIDRQKRAVVTYLLQLVINKLKKGSMLSFHIDYPKNDEDKIFNGKAVPSLQFNELITSLWFQFYMVLQGQHRVIPCKNQNCPCFVIEGKEEYCPNGCKQAQNQRDYNRAKSKAVRLFKEGKELLEIARKLNRSIETVEGWINKYYKGRIKRLSEKGKSFSDIAQKLNISIEQIEKLCKM